MASFQAFKRKLRDMAVDEFERDLKRSPGRDSQGIALLMVLSAISILAFLSTEFVYIAQLNQKLAYDSLDQLKALYIAKSGYKLSLLRLKAYQIVKQQLNPPGSNNGGGNTSSTTNANSKDKNGKEEKKSNKNNGVPDAILDKIWSFPFIYPIPANLPGLTLGDKEAIEKFQKSSGLDGSFSALIESESGRLNLNMILAGYAAPVSPGPSPSPSVSPSPGAPPATAPGGNNPNLGASPSPKPSFDPAEARKSLQSYFESILQNKIQEDPDFQSEYRDFHLEDFMDNLTAWADPTYERKQSGNKEEIPMKRAPFYNITEMHMLPGMDDTLYNLFTPALTVSRTPGINVNSMQEVTLRALVPQMTDDEVKEFFKFRDSQDESNQFASADDFFTYLSNSVAAFKGNEAELNKLKDSLNKRNIRLLTDESEFKITVQATVNESVRKIEAWVTLNPQSGGSGNSSNPTPGASPSPTPSPQPSGSQQNPDGSQTPDTGLKLNFMRVS